MAIITFFIILSVLIIVHELGHFSVAKLFGIRVDEFGLGYPPRAKRLFSWKGTDFTLNWLPFGGFVKIFGESPEENGAPDTSPDSFQNKNRAIQASVLVAGVVCNLIFAWLLLAGALTAGLPAPEGFLPIEHPQTVVTTVVPASPAAEAGLKPGDAVLAIDGAPVSPQSAVQAIAGASGKLDFTIERGQETKHVFIEPKTGIVAGQKAVGISMDTVGIAKLPPLAALGKAASLTLSLARTIARSLGAFLSRAVIGRADLSNVAGPVGLIGLVGDARQLGFGYLLSFTALISLNLAIINLLPVPALDGGRLFFVGLEAIFRRPIPPRVFNFLNTASFALLILLMVLVTIHDFKVIL